MSNTINRSAARRPRQSVPTLAPDLPPVEDLRFRVIAGRIRSQALAEVIAGHAFAVADRWGRA